MLTPHVVQAPSQLPALSTTEQKKSDAVNTATEKELDQLLDRLPTKDPVTGTVKKPAKKKSDSPPSGN